MIGGNQRRRGRAESDPPGRVGGMHMERAGPDFFLIKQDIAGQLPRQRFRAFGVARIVDAIASVLERIGMPGWGSLTGRVPVGIVLGDAGLIRGLGLNLNPSQPSSKSAVCKAGLPP